jgi:hypothetical protein
MIDGKLQLDYLAGLGVRTINLWEWNDNTWLYTPPITHREDLRKVVKACHQRGMQVIPYIGSWASELIPEWGTYGAQVKVIPEDRLSYYKPPQWGVKVCFRSVWQDYLVDGIARLMDECDLDGVYLDGIICTWPCTNQLHGCGYTRPDGSVHPTYPIFAVRETVRRIYTVVKSRKPDGQVCIHTSCAMPAPIMGWSTSHWTGEHIGGGNYDFPDDDTSLPLFRVMCMAPEWGVPVELLHYQRFENNFAGYLKMNAYSLLHDVLVRAHASAYASYEDIKLESKLWRLSDAFGRNEAEWLPYWRNSEYVTASPKQVYVSLYKHPRNGVLAVVSNLSRANAAVHAKFDLDKLGLRKDAAIKDSLTNEPLTLQNGQVDMNLAPLDWKIVWLK